MTDFELLSSNRQELFWKYKPLMMKTFQQWKATKMFDDFLDFINYAWIPFSLACDSIKPERIKDKSTWSFYIQFWRYLSTYLKQMFHKEHSELDLPEDNLLEDKIELTEESEPLPEKKIRKKYRKNGKMTAVGVPDKVWVLTDFYSEFSDSGYTMKSGTPQVEKVKHGKYAGMLITTDWLYSHFVSSEKGEREWTVL